MKNCRILIHFLTTTGCDAYRSFQAYRHCHHPLLEEGIELDLSMELGNIKENRYDACIFHRHISSDFIPPYWAVKAIAGSKVVWDLDDNLFEIPKSNTAY